MERKRDWQISLAAPVISALGMSENGTAITGVCTYSLDANRCLLLLLFFSQLRFRNCSGCFSAETEYHQNTSPPYLIWGILYEGS